jgi:hypothetical protein
MGNSFYSRNSRRKREALAALKMKAVVDFHPLIGAITSTPRYGVKAFGTFTEPSAC